MLDDSAVLAKFPGAATAGLVLMMPDGSMATVDLAGDPLAMPVAPVADVVAAVDPVKPEIDPGEMESMVDEAVQRAMAKMPKPEPSKVDEAHIQSVVDAAVESRIARSIVQPEPKEQPQTTAKLTTEQAPAGEKPTGHAVFRF